MSINSSFYESLVSNDFYEKTASEKDQDVKAQLGGLSDEEMEVLAEELNIFVKQAEESTVEDDVVDTDAGTEEIEEEIEEEAKKKKEKKASSNELSEEELVIQEAMGGKKTDKTEPEDKEEKEEKQDKAKEDKDEEEDAVEAQLTEKAAFEHAGEMLKEAGLSTADYVYGYIKNEEMAIDIAEQSEKLAACVDEPVIKVARDLVSQVFAVIEQNS